MGLAKAASEFRNYAAEPTGYVEQFYKRNHSNQTLEFVQRKKAEYLGLDINYNLLNLLTHRPGGEVLSADAIPEAAEQLFARQGAARHHA